MNTFGEIAAGILGAGIGPAFPRALTAEPGAAIRIDDADLIFKGDYARAGRDLVISHDGKQLVVHDYFAPENLVHGRPASLRGPNGAGLEGDIVAGLAKAGTPDVFAQAGPAPTSDASAAIGRVQTLTGSATAMRNGVSVTLHVGDLVYKGDVLQTDGGSSLAVSFLDGTLFSLGASARMLLNEMVYSANGAGNASMFSLVQGSITFVAGQVAKSGDMKVGTPVATMGIRGTAVHVTIEADNGTTAFSVMTEPDGHTGRFDVYDRNDPSKLLFTVSDPGVSTVVRPDGPFQVTFEQVAKSPAETAAEIAIVQTLFRTVAEAPRLPVFQGPQTGGGAGSSTAPNLVLPDPAAPPAGPNGGGGAPGTSQQPQSAPGSGPGTAPPRDDDRPTQPVVPPAEEQPRLVLEPRNGTVAQDAALVAATATQGLLGPVLAGTPRPVSIVSAHAGGNLDDPGAPLTGETILLRGLYGVLSLARDGTYVYLADRAASLAAGQHGSDVFAFRAADGTGQASALLTIDVVGVNDAPVRTAPLHLPAVEDGGPVILTAAELLAGVTDVDGDALSVTALHVASGGGTLTDLGGGRYRYTPAGAHGSDQPVVLAYTVSDGHGGTLAETVELALPFHNTVPALAGPVTLANSAEDTARIVTVAELLAGASDADGDALSVAGLHVTSGGGTLTDLGNGTYRYTPAADANGPVVLGYTITDGFGGTVAQIASFAVTPVNDAPVLTLPDRTLGYVEDAAPLAVAADVAVADVDSPMLRGATIRVAAGFHAGEDTLAVTLAAGSGLTAQYDQATGTLTLAGLATLAAYSAALASVTYHNDSQAPSAETRVIAFTVIDDAGLESAAVIRSVTVTPVNDAPTVSGAVTLADSAEDTSRIISAAELLAGARDVDGDTLSVLGLHVASGGGT
ncbi:cadherin-like domain-containing protein, partial [Methylobacterium sp. CG09_land_8_20_14_0_10_71_15]